MKLKREPGQYQSKNVLSREEMLYYRLARLKREFLLGLERINDMLCEVNSGRAQQLSTHQLLCLADKSVGNALESFNIVRCDPGFIESEWPSQLDRSCNVCGVHCQHQISDEKTRRVE